MQLFFCLILAFLSLSYAPIDLHAQQPECIRKEAQILNDSAAILGAMGNEKELTLAIDLLDKAIVLSPDYYQAYWNKLVFLNKLKKTRRIFFYFANDGESVVKPTRH